MTEPDAGMLANGVRADSANKENERTVAVVRSAEANILNVDMAIVGYMGRDFTLTGFANYPHFKSFNMQTDEDAVGPNSIDFEPVYLETCSLRFSPSGLGQLVNSAVRALQDSDPEAFENLRFNLEDVFQTSQAGAQ